MTEAHLGRWYMVNRDCMATLCADREDAEKEAADAQSVWPHMGPHRAARTTADSVTAPAAYSGNLEQELAMLIRRIVSSARRNCEDGSNVLKLANEAWTYLVRKGLNDSPLRDAGIESDPTPPAQAAPQPSPASQGGVLDAAFEAVRHRLCGIQRYSFVLDDDGVVRRVQDRTGNWIEFDDAHALFDPVAVDAARKQGVNHD